MHLRLRQCSGNGFGAASPNLVAIQIEAGQRPVEPDVQQKRSTENKFVSKRNKIQTAGVVGTKCDRVSQIRIGLNCPSNKRTSCLPIEFKYASLLYSIELHLVIVCKVLDYVLIDQVFVQTFQLTETLKSQIFNATKENK